MYLQVTLDHAAHLRDLLGVVELLDADHLRVHALGEIARFVEHVGDAARHAGAEVAPGGAEHDHVAAGHVLAAVIAHGFDDRVHAAVAHGEALARHAADVDLAARSRRRAPTLPMMMFSSGTNVDPPAGTR